MLTRGKGIIKLGWMYDSYLRVAEQLIITGQRRGLKIVALFRSGNTSAITIDSYRISKYLFTLDFDFGRILIKRLVGKGRGLEGDVKRRTSLKKNFQKGQLAVRASFPACPSLSFTEKQARTFPETRVVAALT